MPQSIGRTNGTTHPTPAAGAGIPQRFNSQDLAKVWNGGTAISIGASGMGVKQAQQALNDAGVADGAFGPKTEAALKAFQKSASLPQTGKIDKPTLQALTAKLDGNRPAPSNAALTNARFTGNAQLKAVLGGSEVLKAGTRGDGLKAVQETLIDMGFALSGGADGAYGAQSSKAISNFQRHASRMFPDVPVTGNVDAATLRALDALAPKKGEKGQSKNLPNPRYDGKLVRVVVVKSEHRTFLFDKQGKIEAIFPNAVGARATSTENGLKVVKTKLDAAVTAATGKQLWNDPTAFGARILDLSWADGSSSGEELHGTNAPQNLGLDVSHGCVRHDNKDIVTIFNALSVGEKVAIVDRLDDPRLGAPQR
jgi:peptidoglycan hydrolase-like protein with peptidoglycan-binding domain